MHISFKISCTYGNKKWPDVHQPEVEKRTIGKDVRVNAGDGVVAAGPDLADAVITPAERPHRPWLVSGVGTL
jgi:hypothetical protein